MTDNLKKWYISQTMGNLVKTPIGVVYQVFESLFRFKTLDIRWKVVWM